MKGDNFAAWHIEESSSDGDSDILKVMARYAVLAPSSHNSQPWRFRAEGNTLLVRPDMSRALPESDANHRQLYVSLGCAVEHAVLAAEYLGFDATASAEEQGGVTSVRVRVQSGAIKQGTGQNHLARYIQNRRTNRGKYENRAVPPEFLSAASAASGDGVHVTVIVDDVRKKAAASIVSDALVEAMDDVGFRRELSGYIRPNITRAKTGMPMFGFGMPTPISFLAPLIVRLFNVNRPSRKGDEDLLVMHTPAFIVISTKQDDPTGWISAGRVMARLMLEAERCGMVTGPLAAAIQIGNHHAGLEKVINIQDRAQAFFRVGYPTARPPHSPRIPSHELFD